MHYKATGALMDAISTILNVHCAATGTDAGVYVWRSHAAGDTPEHAAWSDILNGGIRCQSLPGLYLLVKIQGSSLLEACSRCLKPETGKVFDG